MQNQVLPNPVLRAEETPDYYRKHIMAAEFGSEVEFKQGKERAEGKDEDDLSQEKDDFHNK